MPPTMRQRPKSAGPPTASNTTNVAISGSQMSGALIETGPCHVPLRNNQGLREALLGLARGSATGRASQSPGTPSEI